MSDESEDADPTQNDAQGPPATFGEYRKKGEESNGVLGMLDTLKNDLEKEIVVARSEEQNDQKEYEKTVKDAKEKRDADLRNAAEKAKVKSDVQGNLLEAKTSASAREKELLAAKKYLSDLHSECDWMLSNFDLRKKARTEEQESLQNAKAVLAGADFSLLQLSSSPLRHLRGA